MNILIFRCVELNLVDRFLGRRQANLRFHFAGSGENLPDIAKSRDTTQYNKLFRSQLMKQNCFLFQGTSCHFFSQSHKLHKISFDGAYVLLLHHSGPALLTSTLHD